MSRDADIVTVAGVELCIRNSGADRVLFMLHGIGSNYSSFDQLSNELPSSIKLIAWNAPGYGGSTPLSSAHPVALDYAKKLNEVIEKLALEKIVLVGHSLGTLIATQFAHHFPEKIDALILMSCAEGYATPENDALPVNAQQRLDDLADKGPRIFAQERAPRLIHQPQHKPKLVEAAIDAMAAIHPHGYAQAVHMLSAGKLSQVAGDTSVRSLTIAGIEDQITPARQSRTCHDALISANSNINHELVEIPDAGHLVHQEQSAKVANSIQNFIRWGLIDASERTA